MYNAAFKLSLSEVHLACLCNAFHFFVHHGNNTCAKKGGVLMCFGGPFWREGSLPALCVGGSLVAVFWWLALARKQFTGPVCSWELSRGVTVAGCGEKAVYGPCVLVRA